VLTALLACAVAVTARAQSAGGDPPSRVARLSEVAGQVWLYSPESNEWLAVDRNRPLTTGDRIATDNGAHAEITLGSTTLRLDQASELEIVRLDDTHYNVRLQGGSVATRFRSPQSLAEFTLDTDEGRFRVQVVGRYRFDRFDQASEVTAMQGQAVYEARNTALPVMSGQHAQFWIDSAGVPQYAMLQPARDDFAGWNDERDRAEDRVATERYVSPEMTGAEDLDRYGRWEQTPEYGALWIPSAVAVGWAPYSAGHWAWVRPWGWTWVDDAPWGFAPFHYGRWVYRRDTWCWAPGTFVARPVYAPALVAWIGGPGVGVSLSVGSAPVGWFPLAPREVYVPAYRASPRYVREVNITHVTNVTNITTVINNPNGERDFANRKFPHAVTVVPAEVIARRQPVAPAAARLRNDPQVREIVANAAPARVMTAPPVTTPSAAPRPPQGSPPPRPPFEAHARGGFGARPNAGQAAALPPTANAAPAPPGPPVRGRGPLVEPSSEQPGARGIPGRQSAPPRDGAAPAAVAPAPAPAPAPAAVAPPSPVQRNAPSNDAQGRPGYRGREVAGDDRGGPKASVVPGPRNNAVHDGAPPREVAQPPHPTERFQPPRPNEVPRATEAARPPAAARVPEAQPPAAQRPPAAVAPPPQGQPRMTRPEAPTGKEERPQDKADKQR
jgi:hypothetical protein